MNLWACIASDDAEAKILSHASPLLLFLTNLYINISINAINDFVGTYSVLQF